MRRDGRTDSWWVRGFALLALAICSILPFGALGAIDASFDSSVAVPLLRPTARPPGRPGVVGRTWSEVGHDRIEVLGRTARSGAAAAAAAATVAALAARWAEQLAVVALAVVVLASTAGERLRGGGPRSVDTRGPPAWS
ncbi:hypothetical protein BH10ACT1_BH10ACT1_35950 [soil metagenome]